MKKQSLISSKKQVKTDSASEAKKESPSKQNPTSTISTKEPQTMEELLSQTGGINPIKKGDVVEGTVVSISPREILVDIGKKSFGIVANWELEQVEDFVQSLKAGDNITAHIVSPENDVGYAVLSLRKSSTEKRWVTLSQKKEKGEDIEVTGLEVAKGGMLVEWQSLRGFIPATQLESEFVSDPAELIGKKIKVKVLEVDQSINRLVLSQKASAMGMSPAVLKGKLSKIKTKDELKGIVSGIAPFGLFVDIDGLEGLVHISEIAWEKVDNPASYFKVGNKVDVMVLEVMQNEGKLNLSIKRLTPDPWNNILDRYAPDATAPGKIVRLASYGVFVQLEPGIEGLIHVSKLTAGEELKVGDEIECVVENVDELKRKISLTLVPKAKPVGYR